MPNQSRKRKFTEDSTPVSRKIRKETTQAVASTSATSSTTSASAESSTSTPESHVGMAALRRMVLGKWNLTGAQDQPGRYLAIDCEMVGVGIKGSESSLARVSVVNYYGAVVLDEYVRQREPVVDYRTQWSGIRPKDLVNGKSFTEVQETVANLLKGNVVVGHAVHHDFKALLLSHPFRKTRDTQYYAHKFGICKSNRVALRDLVKQELNLTIQSGEHCSVTDARAAMAVYRLHQKTWDTGVPRHLQHSPSSKSSKKGGEPKKDASWHSNPSARYGKGAKKTKINMQTEAGPSSARTRLMENREWWSEFWPIDDPCNGTSHRDLLALDWGDIEGRYGILD